MYRALFALAVSLQTANSGTNAGRSVLECQGFNRQGPAHSIGEATPWQGRVSLDLINRRYCLDACTEWHPISRIEGQRVVLVSRPSGKLTVDTMNGELRMNMSYGDLVVIRHAACVRQRSGEL